MRVLVAGATGAVGSRLLPLLVKAGHSVTGLTSTPAEQQRIIEHGAEAIVADGLDPAAIRQAVLMARPDVIVHEMTALGGMSDLRRFDRTFAMTNRLRKEGTDHLLAAARAFGVRRFVAQSFCGWPFARIGGAIKSETDALDSDPPAQFRRTLEAIEYLETAVTQAAPIEGIALRYGAFYGPNTGMLDEVVIAQIRKRRVPLIGDGGGWWSFLHVADAAAATAIAVEGGAPGVYNIVDDTPAQTRDWLPALARLLNAKPPPRLPRFLARLLAGEHLAVMMTEARGASNDKAKRLLGWQPRYPSWREGFAAAIGERGSA